MEVIPREIYQALLLGGVAIIAAGVAWVVAVLGRLAREQNARAAINSVRDCQRTEIQENVRRLVNGNGVHREPGGAAPPVVTQAKCLQSASEATTARKQAEGADDAIEAEIVSEAAAESNRRQF